MAYFTPEQFHALWIILIISNGLSIAGSLLNFFATLLTKDYRNDLVKLVIAISLMDMLFASMSLWERLRAFELLFCQVVDGFSIFGFCGSVTLTCCFSHALLTSFEYGDFTKLSILVKKYLYGSALVSFLWALRWVLTSQYQIIGQSCYKMLQTDSYNWKFLINFEIPCELTILWCGYCYVKVYKKVRSIRRGSHMELLLYPLIMILCLVPMLSLSIRNQIITENKSFVWTAIANLMLYLQGFLNSLVYGAYRTIYRRLCRPNTNSSSANKALLKDMQLISEPMGSSRITV